MVYCVLCMVCVTLCTVCCALCMLYYLCTVQAPGGRPHQEYALEDRAGPLFAQAPLWHRSQTGPRGRRSPGGGRGRTRVVPMTQTTPSKGSRVRLGRRDTLTRREVAVSTPAGPGSHTANGGDAMKPDQEGFGAQRQGRAAPPKRVGESAKQADVSIGRSSRPRRDFCSGGEQELRCAIPPGVKSHARMHRVSCRCRSPGRAHLRMSMGESWVLRDAVEGT